MIVFATETSTVPYTDIVISLTTEDSTVIETTTVPSQVVQTSYTTTVVNTVTSTVTAPAVLTSAPARRKRGKLGRRCAPKQSIASSSTEPSSTESSSSTEPSSSASFPLASDCPNVEAYFSACACISAAATTQTVTAPASTSTSIIPATVSTAIPSTSVSTIIQLHTSTVTVTSPVVSTLLTATSTTTTQTVTTTLVAPTQTGQVVLSGTSKVEGKVAQLWLTGGIWTYVSYTGSGASPITPANIIFKNGQQPARADQPTQLLWGDYGNNAWVFLDGNGNDYGLTPITCNIGSGNKVTCQDPTGNLNTIYDCGGSLLLSTNPSQYTGCEAVSLTIVH